MTGGEINPTEVFAMLINQENSFTAGLAKAQESIEGSCSVLLLTDDGIYASRDRLGRTPISIGKKSDDMAVTFETSAFPNLEYEFEKELGPGEIILVTEDGYEQKMEPGEEIGYVHFSGYTTVSRHRILLKPSDFRARNSVHTVLTGKNNFV